MPYSDHTSPCFLVRLVWNAGEGRASCKLSPTLMADEELLPSMPYLMDNTGGVLAESEATPLTPIGLLSSVGLLVLHKIILADEGLPTLAALVGLLPSVDSLVHDEGRALAEGLSTVVTLVRLLSSMGPLM